MAENLADRLPNELWFMVMDSLDGDGLKTFSSLDQTCRELASPRLFSGIQLSNKTTDFESLEQFVSNHGQRVARIHYDCYLYPRKPDASDEEGVLTMPEGLKSLLAGKGLPKLKTVTVKFHPEEEFNGMDADWTTTHNEDDDLAGDGTSIYVHERNETTQETTKNEFIYQWRADIAEFFAALAVNKTLERLEVSNLAPRYCSVWDTKKWHSFLGRLTSFKLDVWGGDNGACWHSSTLDAYGDFIQSLRPGFFKHLTSAKQVHLVAEERNGIGGTGRNKSPFPMAPEDLPKIEELEAENCFIDLPLSNLICARKDHLKILTLTNCMGSKGYSYVPPEEEITWSTFLKPIVQAKPTALVKFTMENDDVKLHPVEGEREEILKKWDYFNEAEADVNAAREALKADKRLKLFRYAGLDDKYGYIVYQEDSTLESYKAGDDQREYDALMKIVDENRSRQKNKRAVSDADAESWEIARKKRREWRCVNKKYMEAPRFR